MKFFATLLFGLFLASFASGSFDSFEGATIALAHLLTTASAFQSTTILRRRLRFLSTVSDYLEVAKLRWDDTTGKELTTPLNFRLMDSSFEYLVQSLDDLLTAEIKAEVESQFDTFGLGQYLSNEEEGSMFQPFLDPMIAERVAEGEKELLEHLQALAKEDEEKRDRRFEEEELTIEEIRELEQAQANLPADREIVLLTEEDIFGL